MTRSTSERRTRPLATVPIDALPQCNRKPGIAQSSAVHCLLPRDNIKEEQTRVAFQDLNDPQDFEQIKTAFGRAL
jgi:hypothetical protein